MPIMAPRLQGEARADGWADLSLWGVGRLARLRFTGLPGPYVHAPNRLTASIGGLFVAQSAPALAIRGADLLSLSPAARRGPWDRPGERRAAAPWRGERRSADLGWGLVVVERRGDDLVAVLGADHREVERGLGLSIAEIVRQAEAYAAGCDVLPRADPELRSMAQHGAHAALSSIRSDSSGRFAGLAAGEAYSAPARTYYRDAYWTAQTLLRLAPEAVGEAIGLLALGVQNNGEAPSGLILPGASQSDWDHARRSNPDLAHAHLRPLDWWSDHFDSPLLFVLLLADHARATADLSLVRRYWPQVCSVFARYQRLARDGAGLPRKPRNDRDWADNVFRGGLVAYDLGLWIGALDAIAAMGQAHDPDMAAEARLAAASGRARIEARLGLLEGWCADYVTPEGFVEHHLSLDSLTLLRFDAVSPARAQAMLAAVRERLESRHNAVQRWGDWGMLCAWPPYRRRADLRGKSAFPMRYHNGADWPWLDGLYAGERLKRGLSGWRYPMLAWWRVCLERGWLGAVEHFSPPFGRGCLIQAWSSLPLAAALDHQSVVLAGDAETRLSPLRAH